VLNFAAEPFYGERLRLARLLTAQSLDEVGTAVATSRQYLHQLETDAKVPTADLRLALADALGVSPHFFSLPIKAAVSEADCHFRKLYTTPRMAMAHAAARGTLLEQLASALDARLRLPKVDFPDFGRATSVAEIEASALRLREHWKLGTDAPIANVTRSLERAGALVIDFGDLSEKVDALSISRRRPIVVRSSIKAAAVRLRFDLAHECGHLVMHQGMVTGDRETEDEAHRFAGAFLFPADAFANEFPRSKSLDWSALFALKQRWRVSVRAIIRRAYDLGLIDAAKYRTGNIHLSKTGQTKFERYDDVIISEQPEMLRAALKALASRDIASYGSMLAEVGLPSARFAELFGVDSPELPGNVAFLNDHRLGRS
jgi:Zn-dependent peptidase ImmA (M78 family)